MKNRLSVTLVITLVCSFAGSCSDGKRTDEAPDTILLTVDNFEKEAGKGVVMIDFWAAWCKPCRGFAPTVEKIAGQTAGKVKVGKVDIDAQDELSNKFRIYSVPTVIILKDGAEVERFIGVQPEGILMKALGKYTEF